MDAVAPKQPISNADSFRLENDWIGGGQRSAGRHTYVQGDGQTDGRPQRVATSDPLGTSKHGIAQSVKQAANRQQTGSQQVLGYIPTVHRLHTLPALISTHDASS